LNDEFRILYWIFASHARRGPNSSKKNATNESTIRPIPTMRNIRGVKLNTADKNVKNPMIAIHDPAFPARFLV
jgi:hypothetical protein